ncbi:MAG: SDR family NAD(P)-dependent oxidoreductase [Xanthobacteraceae bacterium]
MPALFRGLAAPADWIQAALRGKAHRGRSQMHGLLHNHVAVVTGAGSGIGHAIVLGFAREGAALAVLDINGEAAAKTVAEIRAAGGKARDFALDVTDRMACRNVAALRRRWQAKSGLPRSWSTMPASIAAMPLPAIPTP